MSEHTPNLCEAFAELAEFAQSRGANNIRELAGCWESDVDEHWWVAINGHSEPCECSHGGTVPAFSTLIEWNGWPAGVIDPFGGTIAAGECANEDTFITALAKAKGAAA